MAALTCLDTHVVVLLAEGRTQTLSKAATRALDQDTLRLSPMVKIELAFLYEIGRIKDSPARYLDDVMHRLAIQWCTSDFESVAEAAQTLSWTRDPFDRVIVAQAHVEGARLLSKDETIRKNYRRAVW